MIKSHLDAKAIQTREYADTLIACDQGKKLSKHGLLPIIMLTPSAPGEILRSIYCRCTEGCQVACFCREICLKCTII